MKDTAEPWRGHPPSVDTILGSPAMTELLARFGRRLVTEGIRATIRDHPGIDWIADRGTVRVDSFCRMRMESGLTPVFTLPAPFSIPISGRAPLASEAIEAMARAARGPCALEYDLGSGRRGKRGAGAVERLVR